MLSSQHLPATDLYSTSSWLPRSWCLVSVSFHVLPRLTVQVFECDTTGIRVARPRSILNSTVQYCRSIVYCTYPRARARAQAAAGGTPAHPASMPCLRAVPLLPVAVRATEFPFQACSSGSDPSPPARPRPPHHAPPSTAALPPLLRTPWYRLSFPFGFVVATPTPSTHLKHRRADAD